MEIPQINTREHAQNIKKESLVTKKTDPSVAPKDPKDSSTSPLGPPKKKKMIRQSDTKNPPHGNSLTFSILSINPISFAYPSDPLDPSDEDQLTVSYLIIAPQTPPSANVDTSVSLS